MRRRLSTPDPGSRGGWRCKFSGRSGSFRSDPNEGGEAMKLRALQMALFVAVAAAGFPAAGSAVGGLGVPAKVVDVAKETTTMTNKDFTTDYGTSPSAGDDRVGTTTFRVVKDTGNCCELHLDSTPGGRLFDIGGSYVN